MKKKTIVLLVMTLCAVNSYCQRLSLTDLVNLCSHKNWEDVNQFLISNGWTYYESEKGSTNKYNTITWSYNKERYGDEAEGWFYLYTYESWPNKMSYELFNKESYSLIQNSLTSNGFKLINSSIEDNELISTYSNSGYTLKIQTEKRKDSDYSSRSLTAYSITLIKKSGIYDSDNGKKTEYYYGGDKIKSEYTLKEGKMNGPFTTYGYYGRITKTGNYLDGIENGIFKEYYEYGNIKAEYGMSNGNLNGKLQTYYENGKTKRTGYYTNGKENGNFIEYAEDGNKEVEYSMLNGLKNGKYIEYEYNDDDGKLLLKSYGEYLNDEKNGSWKLYVVEDESQRLIRSINYTNGVKNGSFQEPVGDSLVFGSYKNDVLHGRHKIYLDFSRMLLGGIIRSDTTKMSLISVGNYFDGLKSGYWKNYGFAKTVRSEGAYNNDKKTGEWKYYYEKTTEFGSNEETPYSTKLFLIENYQNDKLNGKSTRYSYVKKKAIPCDSVLHKNKTSQDTCYTMDYKKVLETAIYKDDLLNGIVEVKDSIGVITHKGNFINDEKDGLWLESYEESGTDNDKHYVFHRGSYLNGMRSGIWEAFIKDDFIYAKYNYVNGKLEGKTIEYNSKKKPSEEKYFEGGKLKSLIIYDSLGNSIQKKYEIITEREDYLICRKTEYNSLGYTSQVYWMRKNEEELNHNFFELIFLINTDEELSKGLNGYPDGEYRVCDSNGRNIVQGTYYKKNKTGKWKYYYYNDNVYVEQEYNNNIGGVEKYFEIKTSMPYNGKFIQNYDNGEPKLEFKISAGLRDGKSKYFDKTGKIFETEKYTKGVLDN